jgi:hypothetical protein
VVLWPGTLTSPVEPLAAESKLHGLSQGYAVTARAFPSLKSIYILKSNEGPLLRLPTEQR